MPGLSGVSALQSIPFGSSGAPTFVFDLSLCTFTPAMAERLSPGPFYSAPIVQGNWDTTGTPDVMTFSRGALLGNQGQGGFYANLDPHRGTIVFWITPEWDGDDGLLHQIFSWSSTRGYIRKTAFDVLNWRPCNSLTQNIDVSTWTAGTTYCVVCRWDTENTIDGTHYLCVSVNNVHTYDDTATGAKQIPDANLYVGSTVTSANGADAIIEGLTVYRRVLTSDDGYGVDVGNASGSDELTDIYAAGAGQDPTSVTGSWDVVFCLPTDCTPGPLTTGTGYAWSQPHASNIPEVWGMWDGGLPGSPYEITFPDGSNYVDCGSDASLDNAPNNANGLTLEMWIRCDNDGIYFQKNFSAFYIDNTGTALTARIYCATTNAVTSVDDDFVLAAVEDGKFHHLTVTFHHPTAGGSGFIEIALDGRWCTSYVSHTAASGAYVGDAASNWWFGRNLSALTGGMSWCRLSNTVARYTVGTDFVPPRTFPGVDGTTQEAWACNDGSGVLTASVTSPNNDGTLTGCTWSSIWEVESTPVIPQSVEFNGTTTNLDATSGANIDDLPSGASGFTAEGYFRADDAGESNNGTFWNKTGWYMRFDSATTIRVFIDYDTTDIDETFSWTPDGIKHHWMLTYNENGADRFARVYRDGVLVHTTAASVGNYVSDAASTLYIGNNAAGSATFDGGIGWQALSDNVRASDTFLPNDAVTARANDANMHLRYAMTDGAGATVTDTSGNAYDGTLTNYVWNNTPDMPTDEVGARVFQNGYNVGSDGANDGITIIETVTAETDYVLRLTASYGQSGRAWPNIYIYDNSNAAQIGATYNLPRVSDIHTGANNSATLINSNGAFTQQLVGWTCYNVTDGSSGTITAVSGDKTTITVTLAGGTDNDFDTNDVYVLRPPSSRPYAYYPFATESIFVFRTPVSCTSIDIKIRNAAGEGVLQIHQCEVYESLLDNGDHESLTGGNPDLITGWVQGALDAGDTQASSGGGGVIHAGAEALQWNAGAANNEFMSSPDPSTSAGKFYSFLAWSYGTGAAYARYYGGGITRGTLQYDPTAIYFNFDDSAFWKINMAVLHRPSGGSNLRFYVAGGGAGPIYTDDFGLLELDDVSLTFTPASQANSLEGAGIRVDGIDILTQPIPGGFLTATSGRIQWNYTPRHDAADMCTYGTTSAVARVADFWFDGTRNVQIFWAAASILTLSFNDGGGAHTNSWNPATIAAGTTYLMSLQWTAAWMRLSVDGTVRAEVITPINFTAIPNMAYWLASVVGDQQADAVVS